MKIMSAGVYQKSSLSLLLILFCLAAAAGTKANKCSRLFNPENLGIINRLDDDDFMNGKYYRPNESQFYLFDSALKNKTGALIAAGTFRALENGSRGKFSHVIMADIDPETVKFNKMQIETLIAAPTPQAFIAELPRRPGMDSARANAYLEAVLAFREQDGRHETFLDNEKRYLRLRTLALQGRIRAVAVDIVNPTFAELGRRLKAAGVKVGALDISNILDYVLLNYMFYAEGSSGFPQWWLDQYRAAPQTFRQNLDALPFARNAVVLLTSKKTSEVNADGWAYFQFSAGSFQELMKRVSKAGDLFDVLESRQANRSRLRD